MTDNSSSSDTCRRLSTSSHHVTMCFSLLWTLCTVLQQLSQKYAAVASVPRLNSSLHSLHFLFVGFSQVWHRSYKKNESGKSVKRSIQPHKMNTNSETEIPFAEGTIWTRFRGIQYTDGWVKWASYSDLCPRHTKLYYMYIQIFLVQFIHVGLVCFPNWYYAYFQDCKTTTTTYEHKGCLQYQQCSKLTWGQPFQRFWTAFQSEVLESATWEVPEIPAETKIVQCIIYNLNNITSCIALYSSLRKRIIIQPGLIVSL